MSLILAAVNDATQYLAAGSAEILAQGSGRPGGGTGGAGTAPTTGEGLATTIRNFIAPLFLLGISIVALTFLVQRQVTQFFQFFAIAIGVGVFFYVPGIIEGLARLVAGALGG